MYPQGHVGSFPLKADFSIFDISGIAGVCISVVLQGLHPYVSNITYSMGSAQSPLKFSDFIQEAPLCIQVFRVFGIIR